MFSICPSFVMPYMTGLTDEVEKALFLRKFEVPYWALTYVFGKDDMYWERIENSIGRDSITGTTVRDADKIPINLVADEKKSKLNGDEINIAVTVGNDCVSGAAVCMERSADALEDGYGVFKEEARNVNPGYIPETVTIDGSDALRNAWKSLFSRVIFILCFLHSVLNIKKHCRSMGDLFRAIMDQVWHVYHAETKASFSQRLRRFKEWALNTVSANIVLKKILALCEHADEFKKAYDYPHARRTSNMIDRVMNRQDRYLYNIQYYHGNFISAELNVRAWAILYNFYPCCPRVCPKNKDWICAAERLNGFRYSDNWLENLLIASSMNGYRQ